MPTMVTTARGTGVLATETRRTRDVSPLIAQLEGDAGPLVTLLMRLRSKSTTDPKFEWFEDELLPRFDKLAGVLAAGDATMKVTNYKYFRAGDIVRINKGEKVKVTATPTTVDVAISRAIGSSVAAAAAVGDQLHIIGNANLENAGGRSLLSTIRQAKSNFCQIFRHPFGYSATAMATNQFGQKDPEAEKAKQLIEHKKDLELSFILGEASENVAGVQPVRTTGGIEEFIKTNVQDMNGTMTEAEFNDFMRRVFRYGSNERVGLLSPLLATVFSNLGAGKIQTRSDEKTYGISMSRYQSAGRVIELVEHKLLNNDDLTDLSGIAGWGLFLDIADLSIRYMNGRFTILKENIQANDVDGRQDEYLSEVGLQLELEKKHGMATGVTD